MLVALYFNWMQKKAAGKKISQFIVPSYALVSVIFLSDIILGLAQPLQCAELD